MTRILRGFVRGGRGLMRHTAVEVPDVDTQIAMTVSSGRREDAPDIPVRVSADGRYYAPVAMLNFGRPPVSIEEDFVERVKWLSDDPKPGLFAVSDGMLCARLTSEYMWRVMLESRRDDRPPQVEISLSAGGDRPSAPSEAGSVWFAWDRRDEAFAFARRAVERSGATKLVHSHPNERVVGARPELLRTDDFVHTACMGENAIRGLIHHCLPVLPRAAVETWVAMRRPSAEPGRPACVEFAERTSKVAAAVAAVAAPPPDSGAATWLPRARAALSFFDDRFRCEPELRPGETNEMGMAFQ